MRKAVFLILPITLILFPSQRAQSQRVESSFDRPYLALVKGDTPNSCSFISGDFLERAADIVQDLLFVRPGDSPQQVSYEVRFVPDQPYARDALQWTALAEGNYTKAIVNFRDNRAQERIFTMAINYNQPNEKLCQWAVREPQQGTQSQSPASPPGQ
ncbi:hypothetical protein [Brasilonema bromeliae]|uniref:Uncharacterized protein n=1 Tax=Brasilonema bromeliae SPC951 TaxID=385972 RepID=A0ABX1P453_9CYAN|nr:hypothetical protein [Brasilonema bromeliae]NMG18410.1 hypothetical protein [Brasilonema bromeliae SPC951]